VVGVDSLLRDRYHLDRKVAGGGMGTVFAATDQKLNREVAIKILADHLADDESFVERFRREARAVAGLGHPNIANVYDYGEDGGCHFIVMELAPGRDLARVLREEGPLEPKRVVPIVMQICAALGHAHAAGIVHRDVKPANVILDDAGGVKVTDFGIARAAGDSKLTMTGSVLGTAHYVSPEQANGAPLTPSSDIYSLGIVTYELLTGALPFTGESLMAVAMRHVSEDVPAPSHLNPDVPAELDEVVRRATKKEPRERFADALEMAAALSGTLDTEPVPAGGTVPFGALGAADTEQTVWPIPGDRWDPVALGRKVVMVFAGLALIALVLLAWRLASSPEPGTQPTARQSQPAQDSSEEPEGGTIMIPETIIGADIEEVEAALDNKGATHVTETLEGEALLAFLEARDVSPHHAGEGELIGIDPPFGTTVPIEETITLFVSGGLVFDDDDEDPKGKAKGHDKKDRDEEEGD
jgi:Protein kinase domain